MVNYLCSFAKEGRPVGDPEWSSVESSGKVMLFGDDSTKMGKPSMLSLIKTMLTKPSVGE
jgi:hypothetical protein